MPFAAALSIASDSAEAVRAVCDQAGGQLAGRPDQAVLFFSPHHLEAAAQLAAAVRERLAPGRLLGCVGEAIVGTGREVEGEPAVSLWLARWPGPVRSESFHLALEQTAEGPSLLGWPDALTGADPARSVVLLLGDPFTFPTDVFLTQLAGASPGLRVLGGMASGIRGVGECRLLRDETVTDHGAVGVLLDGVTGLRAIVSQGCRPIGQHMVITRAQDNVILELGGRPPLERLQELWESLPPEDRELFRTGLHVGRVLNEYQGDFQRGDFLVRNVLGIDRTSGALAIGDRVRVGQTVQFHVRDAQTADEDLRELLQIDLSAHERRPAGGLLFSCNGRGTRLFPGPDHDARVIAEEAGPIPLAGLFAMGEIGPVGGANFVHGFTASLALFEE